MLRGRLVLAIWLVATTLSSCESTPTKSTQHSETAAHRAPGALTADRFTPIIAGEADFIDLGGTHAVRFFLRGSFTATSDDVKLVSIDVYGAPGRLGKKQKPMLLKKVPVQANADGEWKIEPTDIDNTGKKLEYDPATLGISKKLRDYTLDVDFNYTYDGGTKLDTVPRRWWITRLGDPTPAVKLPEAASEDGDTITNLNGTGTFYGAQRIAIYDFHVDFEQPTSLVEVFAGPQADPTTKIYSMPFNPPHPGSWEDVGVVGRYNGTSDPYYFKVVVSGNGNPMTKTFTNIAANDGVPIPLSSWVPIP